MTNPNAEATPAQVLPAPGASEQRATEAARQRRAARTPRFAAKLDKDAKGSIVKIGAPHSDEAGWTDRLQDLFGTVGTSFPISQLNHVLTLARDVEGQYDAVKINSMLAAIEAVRPADEVQGMIAVQMVATHELAMSILRRAARVDQIPQFDSAANMAVKLMRTFTMQVEALAKLQRGGEQVVRVVHVHPGGQAVIGNVTAGSKPAGGGGSEENGNQPHAKGELPAPTAQPMPPLWGQDEAGKPLPVSCGGRQGSLPNARRRAR